MNIDREKAKRFLDMMNEARVCAWLQGDDVEGVRKVRT